MSTSACASDAQTSYRSESTLPLSMADREIERMLRGGVGSMGFV
jgi:hypothetical protein